MAKKKTLSKTKSIVKAATKVAAKAKPKVKSKVKAKAPTSRDLKTNLEKAVKTDRKAVEESILQVRELAKYLSSNWKKVLPSIAALGASAYFMKKRGAKKSKTK